MAELAAASSDLPLILDDTDQNSKIPPADRLRALYDAVDALAAGQGRSYSDAVQASLRDLRFRCIGLSSSPETMEVLSQRTRLRRSDGHRVRLLELRVPDGEVGGIWSAAGFDVVRGRVSSDEITGAARGNHGHPGRAWVQYLREHNASLRAKIASVTDQFVRRVAPTAGGVQGRIAHKAALPQASLRGVRASSTWKKVKRDESLSSPSRSSSPWPSRPLRIWQPRQLRLPPR